MLCGRALRGLVLSLADGLHQHAYEKQKHDEQKRASLMGVSRARRSRRGEDGLTEVRDARFFLLKAVMCFTLARIGVGCNSGSCEIAKSRGSVLTEDRVRLYNRPLNVVLGTTRI